MTKWTLYTIEQIAEVIGGGTPSTKNVDNFGGEIPWITPRDLSNYNSKYISNGERNITKKGLNSSSAKKIPKGSILITTRAPVGYVAIAANEVTTNQGFHSLIPKEGFSSDYIYYLIKKNVEYLKANANGSTFGELSASRLKQLVFPFPTLSEQKAIAKILSDLDSKIELNNQMNVTLETIAQSIFKRWFIDFEFPNEEGKPYKSNGGKMADSELGKIPQDWSISKIGKELDTILGGTPSTNKKEYWTNGTVPWINSGKVNEFRIVEPTAYITKEALANSAAKLMPQGTTVLAITGATMGQVSRIEMEMCANQSVIGIIGNEKVPSEYVYFWIKHNIKLLISNQTGGAQQHINKENVNNLVILIPPEHILKQFIQITRPIFNQISNNCFESLNLSGIRDSLLPKLLSGKIRVPIGGS